MWLSNPLKPMSEQGSVVFQILNKNGILFLKYNKWYRAVEQPIALMCYKPDPLHSQSSSKQFSFVYKIKVTFVWEIFIQ